MKPLFSVLLFFVLPFAGFSSLLAQSPAEPLGVVALADGTTVHLRWSVTNPADWDLANQYGYTIARMEVARNGSRLPVSDQAATHTLLDTLWRPLAENNWPAGERQQVGRQILYSSDWDVVADGTLSSAISNQENRENRLFFAHALADQDFALAKHLGLGYSDPTVSDGTEYVYVVSINNSGTDVLSGAVSVLVSSTTQTLDSIQDVRVINGDTGVVVGWDIGATEHLYVNYDIYRAEAGTNGFVRANSAPFLFGDDSAPDNFAKEYAWFTDSVPVYGEYDYYVVGNTPFGITGPPSAVVRGSSRPDRLPLNVRLREVSVTETTVTLDWSGIPAEYHDQLTDLRVFRASSANGAYTELPLGAPSYAAGSLNLVPPPSDQGLSAYYLLEVEDENGHTYRSIPLIGQLEDTTPP
ncbi:MAG: hypothetical protein AAFN92_14710, partial [Bacteroidota bacterium]